MDKQVQAFLAKLLAVPQPPTRPEPPPLEQQAWKWFERRCRIIWSQLNPDPGLSFHECESAFNPEWLPEPLKSAVYALAQTMPEGWEDRSVLELRSQEE